MNQHYEIYTQSHQQILSKKRRRRQVIRVRIISLLLLILAFTAAVSVFLYSPKMKRQLAFLTPLANAVGIPLSKPQPLNDAQIRAKIEDLASHNDSFTYIKEHYDSYPKELLFALCNNPEMLDYALGYLSADKKKTGEFTKVELSDPSPLLLQWDTRWGYAPYGSSQVGLSGCAPTCLSMVILTLTHDVSATPNAVASFAEKEGYYVPGTGTSWNIMTEGVTSYGITGSELSLDKNSIMNALNNHHPIICSMYPGDFTTQGHFIVLSGTEDGKIIVHDPNSIERSQKLWDYDELSSQIKNLWVFYRGDGPFGL